MKQILFIFIFFFFCHDCVSLQKDQRTYDANNIFWKLLTGKTPFSTTKHIDSSFSISFDDINKRTKEHVLIIPKRKYISFSHFADNASPQEMEDLMRNLAHTAGKLGLDKTGYRFITNHAFKPGVSENNNAHQEVSHFHVHLAGNECLGKSVAGIKKEKKSFPPLSFFDDKEQLQLPQSFGWTAQQLIENALQNKISEKVVTSRGTSYHFIAYQSLEGSSASVSQYIGFLILDHNKKSAYTSIHTFASKAEGWLIEEFFSFIGNTAKSLGLYQTGYRLISNHGHDAWQFPKNVFILFLTGGTSLSVTVSNIIGNARWDAQNSKWMDTFAKFKDLPYPHEHCPQPLIDSKSFLKKFKNTSDQLVSCSKKLNLFEEKKRERGSK